MTTQMDKLLDTVEWHEAPKRDATDPTDEGLPYVTHHGVLTIAGTELRCYRLSTGQSIFDSEDIYKLLSM